MIIRTAYNCILQAATWWSSIIISISFFLFQQVKFTKIKYALAKIEGDKKHANLLYPVFGMTEFLIFVCFKERQNFKSSDVFMRK